MKQWQILFKKEMIGSFRDRKWIWVPLVMIFIAVIDPITNYYLPEILDAVGGLPEGALFEFPEITAVNAAEMTLGQLGILGVLVIALISMGAIASERKSGIAELILVKPVSFTVYILSKWAGYIVLVWAAYLLAMLFAWYYIGVLYEFIPFAEFLIFTLFYGLWLTFVVTVSIFYNSIFKSAGVVAFSTLATLIIISVLTSLFGERMNYSPSNLGKHAVEMLHTGEISVALYASGGITILLCVLIILLSINLFQKKEHAG